MARLRSCRVTGRLLAASISNLSVNVSPVNAPALPRLTACQAVRAVRFARAHRAADEAPAQNRWRSRYLGCDAPDGSAAQAGRKYRQLSADYRRERRRQGGGGQVCSPNLARADEPFVAVNCGAIPNDLIESQLFGHERGAFTSAQARHHGYVERARNGILFLDEVGELPMLMQVKLLRLIQERAFTRVGGETAIKSGARIICATNTDLEAAVAEGCSRRDLYYRINVIPVVIPPLRDRSDDILPLTQSFIRELSKAFHRDIKGFTAEAEQVLLQYSWPGNVRELRNRVERGVAMLQAQ